MPSGSHGGRSGGSHGGFSGGGSRSSFGGGSRSSTSFRPRGPRPVRFFGRTVILTTGRQSLISLIAFFVIGLLFFAITMGASVSEMGDHLNMIEEEQRFYLNMIANAETDSRYQVTGEVSNVYYNEDYEKYYITYVFYSDDNVKIDGYSFSVYTLENAPKKGSDILLAVDDYDIDEDTDSIPMDYKNFTLEDDGEYQLYKRNKAKYTTRIIFMVVGVVVLVGGAILVVATAKRKKEEKEEAEKAEQKAKEEEAERKKYCEYCGAKMGENDPVCPQCGARQN